MDTQYKAIQKISQYLKNSQLISLYDNVPFIFKCFNDQHFVRSSAQPHRFFTTLKSREALITTHSSTMASSFGRHFHSYLYACAICAFKDHLATKQIYYSKSLNQKYSRCVCLRTVPGHGIRKSVYVLSIEHGTLKRLTQVTSQYLNE